MLKNERAENEIRHGELLASEDTEVLWGWGTPAGRLRAQRRAALIAAGAHLDSDMHVLEIGCGTGMFTEMFSKTGCSIVAVDISESLLKKAELRSLPKKRVKFIQKRFEDCKSEGPFDAVIGSSVLHHLELKEALPRIFDLLKPMGIMSFAEPNMLNPQVFIERKLRRFFSYISPDETAFVRWSMADLLKQAGFQDVQIAPFDWLHPSVPERLTGLISLIGKRIENIPFLCEFSGSLHITAMRP